MRVTNSMLKDVVQENISRGLSELQKLQTRLASGKAIQEASDDPVGASFAVGLRAAIAAREQFERNGDSARARLRATEDAVDGLEAFLRDARGLTLKGADETGERQQREILAGQVDAILEGLYDRSQNRFGGEYLFGGTETAVPPYSVTRNGVRPATLIGFNAVTGPAVPLSAAGLPGTVTGGSFTVSIYNAAGAVTASGPVTVTAGVTTLTTLATAIDGVDGAGGLTATVGADNKLTITAPAGGTFTLTGDTSGAVAALGLNTFVAGEIAAVAANPKGITGQSLREVLEGVTLAANVPGPEVFTKSVDLFQTLIGLRDALRANNTPAIAATLGTVDIGIDQVMAARGSIGGRIQRLDAVQDILDADLLRLRGLLSRIEDADVPQTVLEFQRQERAYQASLAAGARLIQPSLLDFLR